MRLKGDLFTTAARPYASGEGDGPVNPRGKVMDLLIPIISLVICCVIGMIYTGGFFSGTDFVTAFSRVMLLSDWCLEASSVW